VVLARDILDLELFDSTAAALPQLWPLGVVRLTHTKFYLAMENTEGWELEDRS